MNVTSPSPGAMPANSDRRLTGFWSYHHLQLALVVLLSVLPYLPCLGFGSVYDDDAQTLQNPLLDSWRSLPSTQQSWSFLYPATIANYQILARKALAFQAEDIRPLLFPNP